MDGLNPVTLITDQNPIRAPLDLSFRDLSYTVGKGKISKRYFKRTFSTVSNIVFVFYSRHIFKKCFLC